MAGKIQKQDVKTSAELIAGGSTDAAGMISTDLIYDLTNSKTLKAAIDAGNIGSGMTNPMTNDGDIIIRSGGVAARLAVGTAGQVLKVAAGLPSWGTDATGGGSGLSWSVVTGTTQTIAVGNGYIADNAAAVTLTLPATAAVGDTFAVAGKGAGGWIIAQNASQYIVRDTITTTVGTGGTLVSSHAKSVVHIICTVANTEFEVINSQGVNALGFISATGGTITTDGNYKVHSFTSSSNFVITQGGGPVDSLVVAGGGGGGGSTGNNAGGGGAGGMIYTTATAMSAGTFPVVVGAGGASGGNTNTDGSNGNNSSVNGIVATGGGGGGQSNGTVGHAGGSGGGGGCNVNLAGGAGTAGQGNAGGAGATDSATYCSGGGGGGKGGAGGAGQPGGSGVAGVGLANSITGSAVTYARGGSGGSASGSNYISGNAAANTGNGGSGYSASVSASYNGGSGIVILRYQFQ